MTTDPIMPDASARATDPAPSHTTQRSINADSGQAKLLLDLARSFEPEAWDDWDLTFAAEQRGRRIQRNVVARTRNLMCQAGYFDEVGERPRDHPGCPAGRKYLHFRVSAAHQPEQPTRLF